MVDRTVLTRLKMDVSDYVRGAATAAAATRTLFSEVDRTNDRAAWMAQGFLAIGPALAPIGAAAVPAIAGLATQMSLAAAAAGVTALAFVGVGDGLKALNDYQLAPTAANFAKLQEQIEKLGPAGAEFVAYLDSISEEMGTLREAAREGLFPGTQDGIEHLMSRLPQVRDIIGEIATAMGDLASEAGANIASDRFDEFFEHMERTAAPLLVDMGRTMGNFVDGLAQMMMAFDPLTQQFSDGFLGMSRDFAEWARGLDESESFQEFLNYVSQSVPKVKDFIGAFVDALVALAKASAPVGDVLLPIFTQLLDVFGALIDTPLGSVFLGLAAAMGIYGRAAAIASITTGGMLKNLLPATGAMLSADGAMRRSIPTLGQFSTAMYRVGQSAQYQTANTKAAFAAVGGFARTLGPAVGGLGIMAATMTDFDDKLGVANTTMGAMVGLMASGGPLGAAIGAMVGGIADAAAANNDFADTLEHAQGVLQSTPFDFQAHRKALDDVTASYQAFKDEILGDGSFADIQLRAFTPGGFKNSIEAWFGDSDVEEMKAKRDAFEAEAKAIEDAYVGLMSIMDAPTPRSSIGEAFDVQDIEDFAARIQPALDALGVTVEEINNMSVDEKAGLAASIERWIASMDSVPGRTKAVAEAIAGLEDPLSSAADSATALGQAMEALLGPALNAEEATDKWKVGLAEMRGELEKGRRTFEGYSASAVANREATRGFAEDTIKMMQARAEAGASSKELARILQDSRQAFIEEGVAAGFSRKEMRERANEIGLTPKLVQTVFKAVGIDALREATRDVRENIKDLPKEVQVKLRNAGYDLTNKQIRDLKRQYDLTPKEVRTLLQARDQASALMRLVQREADKTDNKKPQVDVQANVDSALSRIRSVLNSLNLLRDKTINVHTHYSTSGRPGGDPRLGAADGLLMDYYADGGMRLPSIGAQWPQIRPYSGQRGITWSEEGSGPWEAFISGHPAKTARSRSIADEVVSRLGGQVAWFANGGMVGGGSTTAPQVTIPRLSDSDVQRIAAAVRQGSREGVSSGMASRGKAATADRRIGGH